MKSPGIAHFLAGLRPFGNLPRGRLRALAEMSLERRLAKGEMLFNEGDPADASWVLRAGRIEILKYASGGQPIAIESIGPGGLFGILCRLNDKSPLYPCTAVAAAPSVALKIPDSGFMRCLDDSPPFARGLCSLCADRLAEFQTLRCLAQETARVRVAETLLRLRGAHGDRIPFTKREIAAFCAVATETVFRALSSFQKKGWLTSLYGAVMLRDAAALETFAEQRARPRPRRALGNRDLRHSPRRGRGLYSPDSWRR